MFGNAIDIHSNWMNIDLSSYDKLSLPKSLLIGVTEGFHSNIENRQNFRRQIQMRLQQQGILSNTTPDFADLKIRPTLTKFNLTLTHSKKYAAYALVSKPYYIGIDCESVSRVKGEYAPRFNTEEEIKIAPGVAYLWCAKEALFKAFPLILEPDTFLGLNVCHWEELDEQTYGFTAFRRGLAKKARGLVIRLDEDNLLAVCIV